MLCVKNRMGDDIRLYEDDIIPVFYGAATWINGLMERNGFYYVKA